MSKPMASNGCRSQSLAVFQPKPGMLYSLDATAHIVGISRRTILIYARAGLVRPVVQAPYNVITFTEEAIYALRRVDTLHRVHNLDLDWIKTLLDLADEVERLRAEVRFLRNR